MKTLSLGFIALLMIYKAYSQLGATCAEAHVVDNIPFIVNNLTTIGTSYNSLPCSGSGFSNYMSGKDYVFVFTPTQSANYTIKLTNTSLAVGLFVVDKCPDDPSVQCIAENKSAMGNPSLSVNLDANNTYYIIVSSVNFTTPQTNFNIEIQSCSSAPQASFTYTQNGLEVSFTNTSTDASSYLWYFGDELLPPPFSPGDTTTNPVHTYAQYGDYIVTLIAYNACGQTDTLRDTIHLVCPGNLPVASFTYTANGLEVQFTNESTDATSFAWFFGDELFPIFPSDTTANPVHVYTQYGTYQVTLIATNECGSDTFIVQLVLECPGNMPVASFTYNIQPDGTVYFTSTSSDATQWQWFFGDFDFFPFLPGDTIENPVHTYLISGNYTVHLIVSNECGSDTVSEVINVVITNLNNVNILQNIKVYPLPVNDILTIEANNDYYEYKLYDTKGVVLTSGKFYNTCSINFSEFKSGIYLLKVYSEGINRKVVIVKK